MGVESGTRVEPNGRGKRLATGPEINLLHLTLWEKTWGGKSPNLVASRWVHIGTKVENMIPMQSCMQSGHKQPLGHHSHKTPVCNAIWRSIWPKRSEKKKYEKKEIRPAHHLPEPLTANSNGTMQLQQYWKGSNTYHICNLAPIPETSSHNFGKKAVKICSTNILARDGGNWRNSAEWKGCQIEMHFEDQNRKPSKKKRNVTHILSWND